MKILTKQKCLPIRWQVILLNNSRSEGFEKAAPPTAKHSEDSNVYGINPASKKENGYAGSSKSIKSKSNLSKIKPAKGVIKTSSFRIKFLLQEKIIEKEIN